MNCSHDDYGPVDIDELMRAHHRTVSGDDIHDEPTASKDTIREDMGSQECVGDRTNRIRAAVRKAHQNKRKSGHEPTHRTRGKEQHVQTWISYEWRPNE